MAALDREFGARRRELLDAPPRAGRATRTGRALDFLPETAADPRRRVLAGRAAGARPGRPAGRDHRAARAQDDDQRAELRRQGVDGRLRGRDVADLGERRRRAAQPAATRSTASSTSPRPDGKHYTARRRRCRRSWCGRAAGTCREATCAIDGGPVSASLFDFGLYLFHCAQRQLDRGQRPVLLPAEAGSPPRGPAVERRLHASRRTRLGIPRGTIRATVLIETITGRVRDGRDPLRAARALGRPERRPLGLHLQHDQELPRPAARVLPDRAQVTMTAPFMRAYTELLVQTCHRARRARDRRHGRRSSRAATRWPTRRRSTGPRRTSEREAGDGFDGSWVAHPGLVADLPRGVRRRARRPSRNQIVRMRDDVARHRGRPARRRRDAGGRSPRPALRTNVSVGAALHRGLAGRQRRGRRSTA